MIFVEGSLWLLCGQLATTGEGGRGRGGYKAMGAKSRMVMPVGMSSGQIGTYIEGRAEKAC